MKKIILILGMILLLLTACSNTVVKDDLQDQDAATSELDDANKGEGESTMNRIAVIETSMGTMEIELFEDKAPITTKNFIDLIEKGFYDGIIFHRVIENFMIQGGDPDGTGRGGPGYAIEDEFSPELKHGTKGILSMANSGPNSGGSQFFITLAPTPWLDGKHAVFGQVISGLDVLDAIGNVETAAADRPVEEIVMTKVTIKNP